MHLLEEDNEAEVRLADGLGADALFEHSSGGRRACAGVGEGAKPVGGHDVCGYDVCVRE